VCARVFISTALIHQIIQIEVIIKKSIIFNTAANGFDDVFE